MTESKSPLSKLDDADHEWLTRTLTANGHLLRGRAVKVTHAPWKRSTYSYIARLRVEYAADAAGNNGVALPAALVLKFNQPIGAIRRSPEFAHREYEFYRWIAPAMRGLLTPRCYDAVFESRSGRYHFLLEDLSATHTHPVNPLPPSLSDFELIVTCLARLHAAWWNDPRIGVKIGKPFLEERSSRRALTIQKRMNRFITFAGDRISDAHRHVLLNLCAVYPRLLAQQQAHPLTIIHGDAHFENFVIASGKADCRIIDWENWELAPATDDLAYLMAVLWFGGWRREAALALLRRYHDTLIASGVREYSWDALWDSYRMSVVKQLCTPVYQWGNGVVPAIWWNNLERVLSAYEDLGGAQIMQQLQNG
ncbi:MAG: aminoglycoside phosphotransferase family protein [Burkholderiales bacterium]